MKIVNYTYGSQWRRLISPLTTLGDMRKFVKIISVMLSSLHISSYLSFNFITHSHKLCRSICLLVLIFATTLTAFPNIIYRGGVIDASETWTGADTVIVFNDLSITNGAVLLIEAGALVKIAINRGITIDNARLVVVGTSTDSVRFIPNYAIPGLNWKWKGVVIKNAGIENESSINYAYVVNAEIGIGLEDCHNVVIENSSIFDCQNIGIRLTNSSYCVVRNCNVKNNYDGIEMIISNLGTSSNNIISNCNIENQNNNIYIYRNGGIYLNNIISNNIINSGNNGIWLDNSTSHGYSKNIIEKNIFLHNGSNVGYGLFLNYDSTIVRNNIFWENNIAVFSGENGVNCLIKENSFYQNNWAVAIGANSEASLYINNTFALNKPELLGIKEVVNVVFSNNNMLYDDGSSNIVINNTSSNLPIINNYWGTTDTNTISKLIYDKNDNPTLGTLYYKPFLKQLDTANPVSPPAKVIKQLVNNEVKISWKSNREIDLAGYNIYYNNFVNYSFSGKYEIAFDTIFVFPNEISIYDTIAVTSFDSTINIGNRQLTGNESPFALAVLYPYAGADTIVCKDIASLKIMNATIPMVYNKLFWKTSGDGYFSNLFSKSPTYFPGLMDVQNGGAQISLYVISDNDTLIDKFVLSIINNPIAYAGNDTTVIADTDILFSEAYAQNANNVLWLTDGDGSFNFDTIVSPIYHPGSNDISSGVVHIEMIAYSKCGFSSDTIIVNIEPHFSIYGNVWFDQQPITTGVVIAYQQNNLGARAMQMENTQSDGSFRFEKLVTGKYYLFALPDTNNFDNVVPGYYANKLRWQSAYLIPLTANVYDVDISLPKVDFVLPFGDASISGHMEMPQNSKYNSDIYCSPWFESGSTNLCDGGLSNITVLLFSDKQSNLLSYTITDRQGNFYFNKLPYGKYVVDAEKAGFQSIASSSILLSQEHTHETGVIIKINKQKIVTNYNTGNRQHNNVIVAPNPTSTVINIPTTEAFMSPVKIVIFNIVGNIIKTANTPYTIYNNNVKLDVSNLKQGMYFGNLIYSNGISHFSFVKK